MFSRLDKDGNLHISWDEFREFNQFKSRYDLHSATLFGVCCLLVVFFTCLVPVFCMFVFCLYVDCFLLSVQLRKETIVEKKYLRNSS